MLCQRLRSYTPNIYLQNGRVYCFYHVHFPRCLFGLLLFYSLSLSSCSLLVHFPLVVWVSNFFSVNISLQQFICIVFISHIVGFALPCCLLLFYYSLLVHIPCCYLGFQSFCVFKHFFAIIHSFLEYGY